MKNSGFTLIELLVTISILAVLSTIGLMMYQGIQAKTRDGIRKRDLNNLATALEIYFQQNRRYVVNSNGEDLISCTDTTFYTQIGQNMSDNIVPVDPKTQESYCYISSNIGQSYTLCANLENVSDPDYVINPIRCGSSYHYVLTPR